MLCIKCGKDFNVHGNRCPDCGTVYELQYAPPRVEPGPTLPSQTQPTVISRNIPVGKFRPSAGWIASLAAFGLVMLAVVLFILLV